MLGGMGAGLTCVNRMLHQHAVYWHTPSWLYTYQAARLSPANWETLGPAKGLLSPQ